MQAMALNKDPPSVEASRREDETIVPNEDIDEQAGPELDAFKADVMGWDYVPYQGKAGGVWGKGAGERLCILGAQNKSKLAIRRCVGERGH